MLGIILDAIEPVTTISSFALSPSVTSSLRVVAPVTSRVVLIVAALAVIVPALKSPLASLQTIVDAVFASVASEVTVNVPPSEVQLPVIPFPDVAPVPT